MLTVRACSIFDDTQVGFFDAHPLYDQTLKGSDTLVVSPSSSSSSSTLENMSNQKSKKGSRANAEQAPDEPLGQPDTLIGGRYNRRGSIDPMASPIRSYEISDVAMKQKAVPDYSQALLNIARSGEGGAGEWHDIFEDNEAEKLTGEASNELPGSPERGKSSSTAAAPVDDGRVGGAGLSPTSPADLTPQRPDASLQEWHDIFDGDEVRKKPLSSRVAVRSFSSNESRTTKNERGGPLVRFLCCLCCTTSAKQPSFKKLHRMETRKQMQGKNQERAYEGYMMQAPKRVVHI